MASKRLKGWFKSRERDWTFGDGRFCAKLSIETLHKRATSVAPLTNFSFDLFYANSHKMPIYFFLYHGAKTSKMTKNWNQGGPALNLDSADFDQLPVNYDEFPTFSLYGNVMAGIRHRFDNENALREVIS